MPQSLEWIKVRAHTLNEASAWNSFILATSCWKVCTSQWNVGLCTVTVLGKLCIPECRFALTTLIQLRQRVEPEYWLGMPLLSRALFASLIRNVEWRCGELTCLKELGVPGPLYSNININRYYQQVATNDIWLMHVFWHRKFHVSWRINQWFITCHK